MLFQECRVRRVELPGHRDYQDYPGHQDYLDYPGHLGHPDHQDRLGHQVPLSFLH